MSRRGFTLIELVFALASLCGLGLLFSPDAATQQQPDAVPAAMVHHR